jgi:hypothetical protein
LEWVVFDDEEVVDGRMTQCDRASFRHARI